MVVPGGLVFAKLYAFNRSILAESDTASLMCTSPFTIPGPGLTEKVNPVIDVPGSNETSPLITVLPVLVIAEVAMIPNVPDLPSGTAPGARPVPVVNLHTVEYALVPPLFFAFTRQKYVVETANPDIGCKRPVMVESLKIVVANPLLVETCRRYVVAPVEAFQLNVGLVEISVAASAGADKIGVGGGLMMVVKLRTIEYGLVPEIFLAFTRQKYVVPRFNPVICRDVPDMVESLYTVVANVLLVETCNRYVLAPIEAFQLSVGFKGWFAAKLAGATNTGVNGAALVVKLHTVEYELVPARFFAFTRQKYVVPIARPETDCDVLVRVESL